MHSIKPTTVDEVIDPDIQRLREIIPQIQQILTDQPHQSFEPIGKFQEFIDQAMNGVTTTALFEAANGVGKTHGMVNMLANLFWPCDNIYCSSPLFKNWPYPKAGRIISYPNTVTETIIPMMKKIFPKGKFKATKYETMKDGKRYESRWKTDTGWTFTIMTTDQDPKEFESATLGWFWEDEPVQREIHQANYARIRMGGVGFITETPLKGSAWIYDDFVDKTPSDLEREKRVAVHAVLEDACKEHGVHGFIDHQRIVDQVAQYDPDEIQSRVFGNHHHLSGIVFKKWTPTVHLIEPFAINYKDYVVIEAYDPHPRTPDAIVFAAVNRDGDVFLIDEIWMDADTNEIVHRIKSIESKYRIIKRVIDPMAFIQDKHTGYCLAADLQMTYRLPFKPASKERSNAIELIRRYIDYQVQDGIVIRRPKLFCFNTLERTPWEIARWQWQDWRGLSAQFKDPKEKPVDKDDHMIECVGRILLENPKFEEEELPVYIGFNNKKKQSELIDPYA